MAPGHGSEWPEGQPAGPPAGRVEGHRPDAWQGPDGSRAARCVSLGGSSRVDGRYLVPALGSHLDGQQAHQRAGCMARAGCLQGGAVHPPGRPCLSGWAVPGPGFGQSGGRPDGPTAGRAEGHGLKCRAMAGRLQRGALRRPGWLWPRGWAAPGPSFGQSGGRPDGPPVGRQRATGWMPGNGRAARYVALGGSVVAYVSNLDTISAPRSASNPHTSADFGRSWPSGWAGTWSQLRAVIWTSRRPTSGPGRRQRGRMHGKGWMPPGRRGTPPWASLAERVGGTWSQLRAVRRTARRADSGPPEGHGPDARQWPGGSRAARCVALGGSGNN